MSTKRLSVSIKSCYFIDICGEFLVWTVDVSKLDELARSVIITSNDVAINWLLDLEAL